jgi:hypothetical protein
MSRDNGIKAPQRRRSLAECLADLPPLSESECREFEESMTRSRDRRPPEMRDALLVRPAGAPALRLPSPAK